jgi:UDP-N-acetylglucosamine 1-carboxyvinyltransferase
LESRLLMTEKLIIHGQTPLRGELRISGAKNSALKLISAALMTHQAVRITNVPDLSDVSVMAEVLTRLGRKVAWQGNILDIEAGEATTVEAPYELVSKMRASFNTLGALLGRYGHARIPLPGGCSIGKRGIDQHIKGLLALGAEIDMDHGYVEAKADTLKGAKIVLDMPSMGATENIILAAALAHGSTVLSNAAQEPEIIDLANFLNAMGADVQGAGTSEVIINGVPRDSLKGITYEVMPDRIEAATYMAAIIATQGDAVLTHMRPDHLDCVIDKLQAMGGRIDIISPTSVRVRGPESGRLVAQPLMTTFYPGFPTDLQAPLMTLLVIAEGVSMVTETVYENRFRHVGELRRMGCKTMWPWLRVSPPCLGPRSKPTIFEPVRPWSSPAWWPRGRLLSTISLIWIEDTSTWWLNLHNWVAD